MLLGIDLGTSAVKVALFSPTGRLLSIARRPYPTSAPHPLWAEQDPERWWQAATGAIREVVARTGARRVEAVGLCGQTPGQVLVDADGRALGPAIIWRDRRAAREAAILRRVLPEASLRAMLGHHLPIDAAGSASRLLWLVRHRGEVVRRAVAVLQPKDFLGLKLSGGLASDPLSNFGVAHLQRGRYHPGLIRRLRIRPGLLPPLYPPEAVRGTITPSAARSTGLRAGTPVSTGTIDAWCSVCGSGAVEDGMAVDIAGTSEVVGVVTRRAREVAGLVAMPLVEDLLFVGGPTQAGGAVLEWTAALLGVTPSAVLALARRASAGAGGLVFLPYLAGERAPVWDPAARGACVGLTLEHGAADVARAALEGVGYAVRQLLALGERAVGHAIGEVRVCGGAATPQWTALKADITGRPFVQLQVRDTAALGAAMLAGVGCGLVGDLREAARTMVHVTGVVRPTARRRRYDALYAVYARLYSRLRDLYPALADFTVRGDQDPQR